MQEKFRSRGQGSGISFASAAVDVASLDLVRGVVVAEYDSRNGQCVAREEEGVVLLGVGEYGCTGVQGQCDGQGEGLLAGEVERCICTAEGGADVWV